MIHCKFSWDVLEAPCSCIETPTIVGQEVTPQVASLLAVDLGPISNGCKPNIGIGVTTSIISVRVVIT